MTHDEQLIELMRATITAHCIVSTVRAELTRGGSLDELRRDRLRIAADLVRDAHVKLMQLTRRELPE